MTYKGETSESCGCHAVEKSPEACAPAGGSCGCGGTEPSPAAESCGGSCGCAGTEPSPPPPAPAAESFCGGSCACACTGSKRQAPSTPQREELLQRGLRLEYLTVGWNVVEAVVSIAAAVAAGSVALLGFGVDSVVETASGLVLIWRLRAERHARDRAEIERLDQRAHKLVGLSLFLLAAYVAFDAGEALLTRERPAPTLIGVGITALSLLVMRWLASAKRRTARALQSRALEADSFQTTACFWLSVVTLAGIGLNAALGWWWADPVAALAMTFFLVREGREAWRGEDCGC